MEETLKRTFANLFGFGVFFVTEQSFWIWVFLYSEYENSEYEYFLKDYIDNK